MPVSVIIPAWNLWALTAACLESLAVNTPRGTIEVIVVDNGSTDDTATALTDFGRKLFGNYFRPLRLETNIGFARACNAGARHAKSELLFFLNNDTTAAPGWLPPLLSSLSDKTGAIGSLLFYPDGRLQHCGICFNPFLNVSHLYEGLPGTTPFIRNKRPLQAITGAAILLKKNIFWEAGGFCEDYINGFEDVDLCFNLTSRGYNLQIAPDSLFYHHVSQTPGRFAHDTENGRLLMSRWGAQVRPDLHMLAAIDGNSMRLGPDLAAWVELAPDRAQKLASELGECPDVGILRLVLGRHPLWRQGWLRLMEILPPQEALESGLAAAKFFPQKEVLTRLEALCSQLPDGTPQELSKVVSAMGHVAPSSTAMVKAAMRRASGDRLLTSILHNWLAEYSGSPQ